MDRQKRKLRFSQKAEIFLFIEGNSQGLTWRELNNIFPRQTLAHNLKLLVKEGVVEKTIESQHKRRRGRPSTRYKAKAKAAAVFTCKRIGRVPFFGAWARRKSNRKDSAFVMDKKNVSRHQPPFPVPKDLAFKRVIKKPKPKRFVRLFPEEKKEADKHTAWLKEHEPEEYEKFLKLERQKKHPNRRPTGRTKN